MYFKTAELSRKNGSNKMILNFSKWKMTVIYMLCADVPTIIIETYRWEHAIELWMGNGHSMVDTTLVKKKKKKEKRVVFYGQAIHLTIHWIPFCLIRLAGINIS